MAGTKTLILSRFSEFNPDQILAIAALASQLNSNGNTASIYIKETEHLQKLSKQVEKIDSSIFLSELTVQTNSLHLTNVNTEIQDLSWKWQNGILEIELVTPDGSTVNPAEVKLSTGSAGFNQIIFIGLDSVEAVKESLQPYTPDILNGAETIAILFAEPETQIAHQQHIYPEKRSYIKLIWKYILEKELPVSPTQASLLLSALYWKTANFTNEFTSASALRLSAELMERGATLDLLTSESNSTDSPAESDSIDQSMPAEKSENQEILEQPTD